MAGMPGAGGVGTGAGGSAPGLSFRLFGVPVRIDPTFLLVALFAAQRIGGPTGWTGAASWVLAILVGVLVHELGHAFAFRAFDRKPQVTLYALGGLTSARGGLAVGRSLAVSLAGPIAGLAFGGLVWWARDVGLWPTDSLLGFVLARDLLFICIAWGLVNLLPLHPLDGGQAFEAVLRLFGAQPPKAARVTSVVSLVVAVGAGLWAILLNEFFLVLLVGWLSMSNWRRLQAVRSHEAGQ